MIAQCLSCGEEASALITGEFADFPMLCDFVSQAVVLSREALVAAECAGERNSGFRFVGLHVHFKCILARESPITPNNKAWKPAPCVVLSITRRRVFSGLRPPLLVGGIAGRGRIVRRVAKRGG